MFRLSRATPLVAVVALAACMPAQQNPFTLQATPEVKTSQFEPTITINGSEEPFTAPDAGHYISRNARSRYSLRSWIDKQSHAVTHQLYVRLEYYGDWRFFENANGAEAEALPFTTISRDVVTCGVYSGCDLTEIFGVDVPDAVLKAHQATGYAVKVYAKSGHTVIIEITPGQIVSQLAAVAGAIPKAP